MLATLFFVYFVYKTINLSTNWPKDYVGYRQRFGFECKLNNYLLINQAKHSYPHLHSYMLKTKYSRVYE